MSVDDCLAIPEVAKYLRVSVSTVYELLRAGAHRAQRKRNNWHLVCLARGHL
jgi:excisionase family DNA binding protein